VNRSFFKIMVLWAALLGLFAWQGLWERALGAVLGTDQAPIFQRQTLFQLTLEHLALSGLALLLVLLVAVPLSLWVTRPAGRAFHPLLSSLSALGQTVPPVAVLFLSLPIFGFGPRAALLALWLYGLLPVISGILTAFSQLAPELLEAAKGMGMSERQKLALLEWPLALPAILSGVRTSAVLILATATVAPLAGAGGLGVPIIAGLSNNNLGFVLEGAISVALLALLMDYSLRQLERVLTPWQVE
jgi:osmoprotectant transport system permease protein